MMAKGAWVMRTAVMVSILAHASLIGAAGLRKASAPPAEPLAAANVWAGTTALPFSGDELQEVDVAGAPGAEAMPSTPSVAAAPPAETPPPNDPPAPTPTPPVVVVQDKPILQDKPITQDKPSPVVEKKPAKKKPARPAKPKHASPAVPAAAGSVDAPAPEPGSSGPGGSFGVEGNALVADLGKAFTHGLPPSCDSDVTWGKLDVGSAGAIEVAVNINEEGKITGFEPVSTNPPAHLINTVKRTLALIRRGVFTLRDGSLTPGRQVLRLSVELSDQPVTAEEAAGGAAFGLDSHWEGRKGVASFTQVSGRHVDVKVEFVRVEPRKD